MKLRGFLVLEVLLISAILQGIALGASPLEEWKSVPKPVRECVQFAADAENTSLEAIIASGVRPSEPNVAKVVAACTTLTTPLRQRFDCVLKDTFGNTVNTLCREFFAVMQNGQWQEVTPSDAMRYNIVDNQQIATMSSEIPEGAARRESEIGAALEADPAAGEIDIDTDAEQPSATVDSLSQPATATVEKPDQGEVKFPDGKAYVGGLKDGMPEGQGSMSWPSGANYVGNWTQGVREGQGTLTLPNGRVYTGEWKNDQREGQGKFTWPDGQVYVGGWKSDKIEGQGTMSWPDGVRYVGEWRNGSREGQGTMTLPGGKSYSGLWAADNVAVDPLATYSGSFWCSGDVYQRDGTRLLVGDPTYGIDAVETLLSIGGDSNPNAFQAFQRGAYNCQLERWSMKGSNLIVERASSIRNGLVVRLGNSSVWAFVGPQ